MTLASFSDQQPQSWREAEPAGLLQRHFPGSVPFKTRLSVSPSPFTNKEGQFLQKNSHCLHKHKPFF